MSDKKLSFLIKKLSKELGIDEHNERNVDIIFKNLTFRHKEYQRMNSAVLRSNVATEFNNLFVAGSDPYTPPAATLNQAISSRYGLGANGSSKRTRPAEDEPVSEPEPHGDMGSSGTNRAAESATDGLTKSTKRVRMKREYLDDNTESAVGGKLDSTKGSFLSERPSARISDLAGVDSIISLIRELVFYPVKVPELYKRLGVRPPSGILLNGPSGCGKTSLALAIAGDLGLPFFKATGPELVGGTSGESEERIRDLFKAAISNAPSVLFIDSIDVIAPKKDASQRGMDRRIVAQLYDCFDQARDCEVTNDIPRVDGNSRTSDLVGFETADEVNCSKSCKPNPFVILIATTSRADGIDPGLRGRFAQEISLPVPDAPARTKILKVLAKALRLSSDVDFDQIGKLTPGFVGADLKSLVSEAGTRAVKRIIMSGKPASHFEKEEKVQDQILMDISDISDALIEPNKNLGIVDLNDNVSDIFYFDASLAEDASSIICNSIVSAESLVDTRGLLGVPTDALQVTMHDFCEAVKSIQPTAKREGFAVVPNVSWSDVGALSEVREELFQNVLEPIAHPELFKSLGLEVPAGVLFFGPPGCGKTLLAKALANQSGANFISVKGPELLNMYVGESESRVRQVFSRARASAPCVIFFDELDALCPKRGSGADGGSGVSERVVNQLLTELDGLEVRRDVYIIAATNRLELIDDAMLRPGRLGKLLYVPLPSADDRVSILEAVSRNVALDKDDIDLGAIARDPRADGFSGADLAALVREAGLAVLQEWRKNRTTITTAAPEMSVVTSLLPPSSHLDLASFSSGTFNSVPSVAMRHFETAFSRVHASVSLEDRRRHERVNYLIKEQGMGAIEAIRAARMTNRHEDFTL